MLHILLMVLKIIGIILLVLLCVLLSLVCAVLLIPVRYVVKADTKSGVEGKITWFLQLFSFRFWYREGEFEWKLRPRFPKKQKKIKEVKERAEEQVPTEHSESQSASEKTTTTTTTTAQKRTKKKATYTFKKICDKIKHIVQTKERIVEFITDEVHVAAFGKIKVEVGKRIRHFRPKVVKGYVRYGCEDPYDTGRILAALSVLYPFYGNEIQIYPEFEQVILEGDVLVKGHIRGIHAGILVWNLFFDENIRKTYQEIRRN